LTISRRDRDRDNGERRARVAVVNPFAGDPERALPWEQGYLAGYAEPDDEHLPPLEGEALEIFSQGEQTGRDDRATEPSTKNALPVPGTRAVRRFEAAPDGTLIPIPEEVPQGNRIREDAQVTASVQGGGAFYYVVIYNEEPSTLDPDTEHLIELLFEEPALNRLEHLLAEAVLKNAAKVVKFGVGLGITVAVALFTPSPILSERRFRGYTEELTPVDYVVLQRK
jgi:hypothetical protein